MNALILAGGLGTRLRPLTNYIPKPLIPLVGKPLVMHIIDSLPDEVDTVILAVSYMRDKLEEYFKENDVGKTIILVSEEEPLGTGGAIKNVSRYLDDTFIVMNGDVVCSLNINDMLKFHKLHGGIGSMSLWTVEDPSAFGVVGCRDARIETFQEKPKREEALSNLINAGTYIFEKEIFDYIPDGVVSIEKQVFPKILDKGMYGYEFDGYWIDCGTRANYIAAQKLLLNDGYAEVSADAILEDDVKLTGQNLIKRAHLRNCTIGPNVYIEDDVLVSSNVTVSNSMLLRGSLIEEGSIITNSVISQGCVVTKDSVVTDTISAKD